MAEALAITKKLGDIKTLFNKIDEVFFFKTANQLPSALTTADFECPVGSDGVTFNTGDTDVTRYKLTTGETWTSLASAGDCDISFAIASVDGIVNDTFLNKETTASVALGATIEGHSYSGDGYNLEPKKVVGGLLMCSEDKQVCVYLPNVEMYSSLQIEDGKPMYHQISCTPLASTADGATIYFLKAGE